MNKQQIIDILEKESLWSQYGIYIHKGSWEKIADRILELNKKPEFKCLYCQKVLKYENNYYICKNPDCKNADIEMI